MGIGIGRCKVHVSFVLHQSQLWLLRCCAFVLWRIANRCYKLVQNGLESSAPGSGPYIRTGSVTTAQRELRRQWGWQRVPSWRLLHQWSAAFQTQGTMVDAGPHAPRPRVPAAVVRAIRRAMGRNPRLSIRRLAARVGASRTAVHRVLRLQLGFYPYKLQVVQRLKRVDKAKMLRFCFGGPQSPRHCCTRFLDLGLSQGPSLPESCALAPAAKSKDSGAGRKRLRIHGKAGPQQPPPPPSGLLPPTRRPT